MNVRVTKLIQALPFLAAVYEAKNFTKTAELLGVHQTAVSHRISAIEEMLDVILIERTTRALHFTQSGHWLCEAATKGVADIETVLHRIMQARYNTTIRVSAPPSLAMKWLVPHMMKARDAGIDISILAQTQLVDFSRGEADVGIRFGHGNYPELNRVKLCGSYMQALASPAYIRAHNIDPNDPWASNPDILVDYVSETDPIDWGWQEYAAAEPTFNASIAKAPKFDRTDLAIQAAISGLGVALGRSLLYEHEVESGFLVPLGKAIPAGPSDWLVCSHEFARTEQYKKFAPWLQQQIRDTHAIIERFKAMPPTNPEPTGLF